MNTRPRGLRTRSECSGQMINQEMRENILKKYKWRKAFKTYLEERHENNNISHLIELFEIAYKLTRHIRSIRRYRNIFISQFGREIGSHLMPDHTWFSEPIKESMKKIESRCYELIINSHEMNHFSTIAYCIDDRLYY